MCLRSWMALGILMRVFWGRVWWRRRGCWSIGWNLHPDYFCPTEGISTSRLRRQRGKAKTRQEKYEKIGQKKLATPLEELCQVVPPRPSAFLNESTAIVSRSTQLLSAVANVFGFVVVVVMCCVFFWRTKRVFQNMSCISAIARGPASMDLLSRINRLVEVIFFPGIPYHSTPLGFAFRVLHVPQLRPARVLRQSFTRIFAFLPDASHLQPYFAAHNFGRFLYGLFVMFCFLVRLALENHFESFCLHPIFHRSEKAAESAR